MTDTPNWPYWKVVGGPCSKPMGFFTHEAAYDAASKLNQPAHSGSESACGYTYKVVSSS